MQKSQRDRAWDKANRKASKKHHVCPHFAYCISNVFLLTSLRKSGLVTLTHRWTMQASDPEDCERKSWEPPKPQDQALTLTIVDKTEGAFP